MSVITAAPPALLPELLGVSPHFVLDTIVNISNNSVEHCVDAMEEYLNHWAEKRAARLKGSSGEDDWDSRQEVEQGIVSFQTLLESHMDIALDCFEVWCMRNIFTIPAELPVVVPHQAGLILDQPASKEQELLAEIDDLRRRIQVVRSSLLFCPVGQFIYSAYIATKTEEYVQKGVADFCRTKNGERADFESLEGGFRRRELWTTRTDFATVRGHLGDRSVRGRRESDCGDISGREARMGDGQTWLRTLGRHRINQQGTRGPNSEFGNRSCYRSCLRNWLCQRTQFNKIKHELPSRSVTSLFQ
jgi:hypothetical protein